MVNMKQVRARAIATQLTANILARTRRLHARFKKDGLCSSFSCAEIGTTVCAADTDGIQVSAAQEAKAAVGEQPAASCCTLYLAPLARERSVRT